MHRQVPTKDFRKFVQGEGCTYMRTKGSHESWSKPGMMRPVVFQSNVKEVPEFIVKNNLKALGVTMDYMYEKMK